MSIPTAAQPADAAMSSEKHKPKSSKKDKSSHSEKKRKRDHGDDSQKKSKKHKSDKRHRSRSQSITRQIPEISPFHMQTCSLYLPLAPLSQKTPLEGLCAEHISPLILTYYPPFAGVILSYSNPRLSEKPFGNDGPSTLLLNIDEYATSWCWVTAEFLLFKPDKGAWIEGYVNLQNEGHLGIVCWNLFNASIERKRLPDDWKWVGVEDQSGEEVEGMGETYAEHGIGYWADGDGKKVEGTVKFKITEIESNHDKERGFLSIAGTMLDETAETQMTQLEMERNVGRDEVGRRLGGLGGIGATMLGVIPESDLMDVDTTPAPKKKRNPAPRGIASI